MKHLSNTNASVIDTCRAVAVSPPGLHQTLMFSHHLLFYSPAVINIQSEQSADRPAEVERCSLFGIPGHFEEPPVCLPVRLPAHLHPAEACCRGRIDGSVQQDRDEWKIFTASIDQRRSTNSRGGSAGPWHAGFFFHYIGPETRQAERMEGGGIEG